MSFTEIYWINSMKDGAVPFCERKNNATKELCPTEDGTFENSCRNPVFTGFISTIFDLFWALFGQFEISCLRSGGTNDEYYFEDGAGLFLIGLYYISIAFVLLNLLIALMSESVNNASENKENVWKFDKTDVWFRFIHCDCIAPPPMNILLEFYITFNKYLQFCKSKAPCKTEYPVNKKREEKRKKAKQKKIEAKKISISLVKRFKASLDGAVQDKDVQPVFL